MDARILKTKETIHRAIIELLRAQRLSEISVSALCQEAGINRNTFYAHYHTPVDVVEELSNELIGTFERIIEQSGDNQEISVAICRYLYQNRELFNTLCGANCEHKYLDIALKRARDSANAYSASAKQEENGQGKEYFFEFVIGGIIFVLNRWGATGMQESPEEIGRVIHTIFTRYAM